MGLVDPASPNLRDFLSPSAWAGAFESQLDPGPSVIPGYVNERYRVETIFDEINAAGPLPGIPVTYLAATIKPSLDQLPPADQARALDIVTRLPVERRRPTSTPSPAHASCPCRTRPTYN